MNCCVLCARSLDTGLNGGTSRYCRRNSSSTVAIVGRRGVGRGRTSGPGAVGANPRGAAGGGVDGAGAGAADGAGAGAAMAQRAERALPRGARAAERRRLWRRALVLALRVQALRDAQVSSRTASQVVALWEHDPDEVNHSTRVRG